MSRKTPVRGRSMSGRGFGSWLRGSWGHRWVGDRPRLRLLALEDRTLPAAAGCTLLADALAPPALNIVLVNNSVAQAAQVSQAAERDVIAVVYDGATMTT